MTRKKASRRLFSVYEQLKEYGFQAEQIEEAILQLPKKCASLDLSLDWLMLAIPSDALPKSFRNYSGVFSTQNLIEIIQTSNPGAQSSSKTMDVLSPAPLQSLVLHKKPKQTQDGGGNKDWILQYLQQSTDEEEGPYLEEGPLSGSQEWEIWSDPREVERRKRERNEGELTEVEKRTLVLQELEKVKLEAAGAKKMRDSAKQRKTGIMIQQLKAELGQLGIFRLFHSRLISYRFQNRISEAHLCFRKDSLQASNG